MAAHDIKLVAGAHSLPQSPQIQINKIRAAKEITSKRKCVRSAHPKIFGRGEMVRESVGRRNGRQHRVGPVHTGGNKIVSPHTSTQKFY